jgi:ureidoacrylate peracid hydrolase
VLATGHVDCKVSGVMRALPKVQDEAGTGDAKASSGEQSVSFVRPRKEQRVARVPATPQSADIDLNAAALIVVDMQNDFVHPDGWFAGKGIDLTPIRAVIPAIERLATGLRRADIPVIWLNWGVRADRANLPSLTVEKGRNGHSPTYSDPSPSGRGRILVRDDWGAAIADGLTVAPSDLVVHKHRLSGFWDNELDSILRQRGITTLLFAGVNIDRCVFSTLQDANFLGYDCMLVEDSCQTVSPDFVRDAVLYLVRLLHGVVASSDAILTAVGQPGPAPASSNQKSSDRSAP